MGSDAPPLPNLARIVGEEWIARAFRAPRQPGEHPFNGFCRLRNAARDEWLTRFDRALEIIRPLLDRADDGRDRHTILRGKLRSDTQFWSTVPEVLWAARLQMLGAAPVIEPQGGGPDLCGILDGQPFFVEIYSPRPPHRSRVATQVQRTISDGLRGETGDFLVRLRVAMTKPDSHKVAVAGRRLRRVLRELRESAIAPPVTIYLEEGRVTTVPGHDPHHPSREIVLDPNHPWKRRWNTEMVVEVVPRENGEGMLVVGTQVGAYDPVEEARALVSGLGRQLVSDVPNVFVVAEQGLALEEEELVREAWNGAFARHPQLSAIVVARWGVYLHEFVEDYRVIPTTNPRGLRLSHGILAALQRRRLV